MAQQMTTQPRAAQVVKDEAARESVLSLMEIIKGQQREIRMLETTIDLMNKENDALRQQNAILMHPVMALKPTVH